MTRNRRIDASEPAHLRDVDGYSPPIHRFAPAPELADVVRRHWIPVWSLPDGSRSVQRVLQYPVCNLVIEPSYAIVVGPTTGLSTRELNGSGWALGAMLQPAAGALLLGGAVSELTDSATPLETVPGVDGVTMVEQVRSALAGQPESLPGQQAAIAAVEDALAQLLPVDDEGLLVNAIVEYVEGEPRVQRVSQVCEKFDISERSMQRLTARRIGLTPKWLVQRRRLHEAAGRLASAEPPDLARVAMDLGYADQAHFTRDFRTVTGLTPGEYAAEPRGR